ncbi:MAG: ShlB/FhaC/HecB family hemolysin secretion/activation protein [Marinospirillum sp.]|uniref:ShlB/FhaC/HecB family hemolysin secretion/activation protein n=1 Tax=Marinospirillum sp. TaxID=2183934 RepID=UPI0019E2407B|nr:ShlB/FhaC/HecB family hemolysin secretion/activation protein [Marinospirillum sp.]MBE0507856.1 ShlB/FhaC/HecB family hemolysin secretion/activation protein [Marinospirillum sp.]
MELKAEKNTCLLLSVWPHRLYICLCFLSGGLLVFGFIQPATAQQLPESAQPGAIQPHVQPRIPPQPSSRVLEIPPLVERPLSADEGERIQVSEFRLTDAKNLPEYGIRLTDLQQLLDAARDEQPEGFTIGQMEAVTNRITNYYRSKGLILAKAVLPVQTVTDGVVDIQVIEGHLGRVLAENNRVYSTRALSRPFNNLKGRPVSQQEAESALLILTDFPGLAAFGMFQPGQKVGEADLLIRVPNEERFNASLRVDNHGSETTGIYRGRGQLHWNNITGNADRLSITLQQSAQPQNSQYGALDYHIFFNRYWQAGGYARQNTFDVGGEFESLEISGESSQYGLYGHYQWIRSRERNLSSKVELASKYATTERMGEQINEDRLTLLNLGINYDSVDTRFSGLNYAGIEISQGFNDLLGAMGDSASSYELDRDKRPSRQGGERGADGRSPFAEGEFTKVLAFYSRLQNLTQGSSLLLRSEFQYSADILVPMEQYAVGGADHVRGFNSSYTMYDTGGLVSLEYILQAPLLGDRQAFGGWRWRDMLQFSIFYDHSLGEKNSPMPNEPQGMYQMSGAGVGIRFNIPNQLTSRIQLATPLTDESGNDDEEKAQPQVWFDFAWHF